MSDAPDYLKEAEAAIRRDPLSQLRDVEIQSFSELQNQSRDELLRILIAALGVPNGMTRKSAAFALGQVGDDRNEVLEALVEARKTENARGNIEGIEAAIAVLKSMPLSSGSTELERRKAVENAYLGRPLDSSSPSPYSQTTSQKKSGCFSTLLSMLLSLLVVSLFLFHS